MIFTKNKQALRVFQNKELAHWPPGNIEITGRGIGLLKDLYLE